MPNFGSSVTIQLFESSYPITTLKCPYVSEFENFCKTIRGLPSLMYCLIKGIEPVKAVELNPRLRGYETISFV